MTKIRIKLTNERGIFHDTSQGVTLTGDGTELVAQSLHVARELRAGTIIEVEESEDIEEEEVITDSEDTSEEPTNDAPPLGDTDTEDAPPPTTEHEEESEEVETEDTEEATETPYSEMLKADLADLAVSKGLEVPTKSTKDEIIELLQNFDNAQTEQ